MIRFFNLDIVMMMTDNIKFLIILCCLYLKSVEGQSKNVEIIWPPQLSVHHIHPVVPKLPRITIIQ